MTKIERNKELLTPKVDKKGTKAIKRSTVEIDRIEEPVDEIRVEQLKKSRLRLIVIFGIVDLVLFAFIVYQVVKIFMTIAQNVPTV